MRIKPIELAQVEKIKALAVQLGREIRVLEKLTGYPQYIVDGRTLEICVPDIACDENGGDLYTYNLYPYILGTKGFKELPF